MLHARRAGIGIVAAGSVAQASAGFAQVSLLDDPYVLVVPEALPLDSIQSEDQLAADQRAVLNSAIQFIYGTHHQRRVEAWYEKALPDHRVVARCRSFEVAIAMVRAGVGICVAPALSCFVGNAVLNGIRLYDVEMDLPRSLVALVPSQYRHRQPYVSMIDAMRDVAHEQVRPQIRTAPAFLVDGRG
jgi:DNA-binding transcriptional LysR family regulator